MDEPQNPAHQSCIMLDIQTQTALKHYTPTCWMRRNYTLHSSRRRVNSIIDDNISLHAPVRSANLARAESTRWLSLEPSQDLKAADLQALAAGTQQPQRLWSACPSCIISALPSADMDAAAARALRWLRSSGRESSGALETVGQRQRPSGSE
ncbi:hypothetical protein Landi51_07004 [Colletotrichum acutatum]